MGNLERTDRESVHCEYGDMDIDMEISVMITSVYV